MISTMIYQHKITGDKIEVKKNAVGDYVYTDNDERKIVAKNTFRKYYKYIKKESKIRKQYLSSLSSK